METTRPILILAATEVEMRDLRRVAAAGPPTGRPVPCARGTVGGIPVVLAVTGAGKASAAFAAGWLLAGGACRALVSVGCAGAFRAGPLAPGDVVIADREIFADEGAETDEGFLGLDRLGLPAIDGDQEVTDEVPILPPCRLSPKALAEMSESLGFPVRAGPLCTVSTVSGTDRRAAEVFARRRPAAESMEGAALALCARRAGIPFLEVRGISNYTGTRDRGSWDVAGAAARAAAVAARIIGAAGDWRPPAGRRPE